MIKKYFSKKSSDLSSIKKTFFINNNAHLKKIINVNKLYIKHCKKRIFCKNCENKLSNNFFKSFGIKYFICKRCEHLNGEFLENEIFLNKIYASSNGKKYAQNYLKFFNERVKKIYYPKAKFLKNVLGNVKIIEIGAGGGLFLKACENAGIGGVGYETNKTLVNYGKKKLSKNELKYSKMNDIKQYILNSKADCLVLIGVLEHLENPREILKIFKSSKIKFIFLSLPLFSLITLIEHLFPNIYPRQLGGAHTHLYTKKSIDYFIRENNFKKKGEWWFGQDFNDIFRTLSITSKSNKNSILSVSLYKFLGRYIDELQSTLDKNYVSSEVHIILKK